MSSFVVVCVVLCNLDCENDSESLDPLGLVCAHYAPWQAVTTQMCVFGTCYELLMAIEFATEEYKHDLGLAGVCLGLMCAGYLVNLGLAIAIRRLPSLQQGAWPKF